MDEAGERELGVYYLTFKLETRDINFIEDSGFVMGEIDHTVDVFLEFTPQEIIEGFRNGFVIKEIDEHLIANIHIGHHTLQGLGEDLMYYAQY